MADVDQNKLKQNWMKVPKDKLEKLKKLKEKLKKEESDRQSY